MGSIICTTHTEQMLRSRSASLPFSILDLGCGETAIVAPMLANMEVRTYEGVVLALAEQHLTDSDLLAALKQGHRRHAALHSSSAVHHVYESEGGILRQTLTRVTTQGTFTSRSDGLDGVFPSSA